MSLNLRHERFCQSENTIKTVVFERQDSQSVERWLPLVVFMRRTTGDGTRQGVGPSCVFLFFLF